MDQELTPKSQQKTTERSESDQENKVDLINEVTNHHKSYEISNITLLDKTRNSLHAFRTNQTNIVGLDTLPIRINLINTQYKVIKECAKEIGWQIILKENHFQPHEFDVFWSDVAISSDKLQSLKIYQRINHFPAMNQITRKGHLSKNLKRMKQQFPDDFNFFPKTWFLPAELNQLKTFMSKIWPSKRNEIMIVKPDCSSQGRGIFLAKKLEEITSIIFDKSKINNNYVVQRYISDPYLIDNLKFDLRIYVLVTSCNPLRIYLYEEGIARFATQNYEESNLDNFIHLTNYAINKKSENFKQAENIYSEDSSKRTLQVIYQRLEKDGVNISNLKSKIKDVIRKTLLSIQHDLYHNYRTCQPTDQECQLCFEILGFDILIDKNAKPWLLEVNQAPSFSTDSELDYEIKKGLIYDTFRLLNITPEQRRLQIEKNALDRELKLMYRNNIAEINIQRIQIIDQFNFNRKRYEQKNTGKYQLIYPIFESQPNEKYADIKLNQCFELQQYYETFSNSTTAFINYLMNKKKSIQTNSIPTNSTFQHFNTQEFQNERSPKILKKTNNGLMKGQVTYIDVMESIVQKISQRINSQIKSKLEVNYEKVKPLNHDIGIMEVSKTKNRNSQQRNYVKNQLNESPYNFIKHNNNNNNKSFEKQYGEVPSSSMRLTNLESQLVAQPPLISNHLNFQRQQIKREVLDQLDIQEVLQTNQSTTSQRSNNNLKYINLDRAPNSIINKVSGVNLPVISQILKSSEGSVIAKPHHFNQYSIKSRTENVSSKLSHIKVEELLIQKDSVNNIDQVKFESVTYVGPQKTQIKTSLLNSTKTQQIQIPQDLQYSNINKNNNQHNTRYRFPSSFDQQNYKTSSNTFNKNFPKYNNIKETVDKYLKDGSPLKYPIINGTMRENLNKSVLGDPQSTNNRGLVNLGINLNNDVSASQNNQIGANQQKYFQSKTRSIQIFRKSDDKQYIM